MYHIIIIILLLILFAILVRYILYMYDTQYVEIEDLEKFNNHVPYITPPTNIVIDANQTECHKTPTPCTSHADCDQCREGLANCQQFDERTILQLTNEQGEQVEMTIEPGESYCLALDRMRARSCNPNTGVWLLALTDVGFSLLCNCITPGLVTQLNLYEDCNVAIGCQPHGQIADINERPMRCLCDDGYVADFDEATLQPLCRPMRVRDVMYDESTFKRAPCDEGFIRVDHPALRDEYRQTFILSDICVPDPCSIDPVTGLKTDGYLMQQEDDGKTYNYCVCPIERNLFGVYSSPSMVRESFELMTNACIMPFNQIIDSIRIDYKFFWGRDTNSSSDEDVVAATPLNALYPRYRTITYPYLENHPDYSSMSNLVILKFSTSYTPLIARPDIQSSEYPLFFKYLILRQRTTAPCFYPGEGRCITANAHDCIRRHNNTAVNLAQNSYGERCVFSREDYIIKTYHNATYSRYGNYPAVFLVRLNFALNNTDRVNTVMWPIYGVDIIGRYNNPQDFGRALNTYPNYSVT